MQRELRQHLEDFASKLTARSERAILGPEVQAATDDDLRGSMNAYLRSAVAYQRKLVLLPMAAIVLMFLMAVWLTLEYSMRPPVLAGIFGATGLTLAAPIKWIVSIMRDLWRMEFIAAMVPRVPDGSLAEVIRTMLGQPSPVGVTPGSAPNMAPVGPAGVAPGFLHSPLAIPPGAPR